MMFALGLGFEFKFIYGDIRSNTWFKLNEAQLDTLDDLRDNILARPVQAPLRDDALPPAE